MILQEEAWIAYSDMLDRKAAEKEKAQERTRKIIADCLRKMFGNGFDIEPCPGKASVLVPDPHDEKYTLEFTWYGNYAIGAKVWKDREAKFKPVFRLEDIGKILEEAYCA